MRKITVKHVGAYGKPVNMPNAKNRRAVAAANIDRHRPLKGVTLSVSPWRKANATVS